MASQSNRLMFDLLSYARRGPGRRDSLSPAEILQVARTVGRTPEVMVKILPRGATDLVAVRKHLDYIGRKGKVEFETDDGEKRAVDDLLDDWDLDLDEARPRSELSAANGRQPPRLVHKVLFSMPAGTPPAKVLAAVQNFCREEFALKHRYVMALHTDEPHPHVHLAIKALGVPANATHRFVRGDTTPRKSDGIYRAALRGESTHMRDRAESVARELAGGALRIEAGKAKLLETRADVYRAWQTVGDILVRQQQAELAKQVIQFMHQMPSPMTENEKIAAQLVRLERELLIGGRRPPVR